MRALTEAELGGIWAALAAREGHAPALPEWPPAEPPVHRRSADLRAEALELRGEGLSHRAIAASLGVSRGRVSQLLADGVRCAPGAAAPGWRQGGA